MSDACRWTMRREPGIGERRLGKWEGINMRNLAVNELEPFGVMSKKAHISYVRQNEVNWTLLMW